MTNDDYENSTSPLVGSNSMWLNMATMRKAIQYYFDNVVFKADAPFVHVVMQASDTKEFQVTFSDKVP